MYGVVRETRKLQSHWSAVVKAMQSIRMSVHRQPQAKPASGKGPAAPLGKISEQYTHVMPCHVAQ